MQAREAPTTNGNGRADSAEDEDGGDLEDGVVEHPEQDGEGTGSDEWESLQKFWLQVKEIVMSCC